MKVSINNNTKKPKIIPRIVKLRYHNFGCCNLQCNLHWRISEIYIGKFRKDGLSCDL
jgi:hypothetical protein